MRRMLWRAAAGLGAGLALLLSGSLAHGSELKGADPKTGKVPAVVKPVQAETGECSSHGTSVQFHATPSEAARQAKKEQKLVFVLHISGNFEDPDFT